MRNVLCIDNVGGIASTCNEHERPASSSPCNTDPCPDKVRWKYGDWSQVTVDYLLRLGKLFDKFWSNKDHF